MNLRSSHDNGDLEFTHAGASRDSTVTRNTCHLISLLRSQSHVYFMFFPISLSWAISGGLDALQRRFVAANTID